MHKELVFATSNLNKLKEVQAMIPSIKLLSLKDIGCTEEIIEDGKTIEANAIIKAKYVFDNYHLSCFADDTGLEVGALNGLPGVDTAHYSGSRDAQKNMKHLLNKLSGIKNREAQFKTVIAYASKDKMECFEGVLKGNIAYEQKGDRGFGYDPIFLINDKQTLAEISLAEKNLISHRSIAFKKFVDYIQQS